MCLSPISFLLHAGPHLEFCRLLPPGTGGAEMPLSRGPLLILLAMLYLTALRLVLFRFSAESHDFRRLYLLWRSISASFLFGFAIAKKTSLFRSLA